MHDQNSVSVYLFILKILLNIHTNKLRKSLFFTISKV